MVNINRKTYEKNGIGAIIDNDGILKLNDKHLEEGLVHKNLREITIKFHSDHREHDYEIIGEPKKQLNRIFIDKKLAVKVLMDCRTTSAHKIRTKLGFEQYDAILTKYESVLRKIKSSFEGETSKHNMFYVNEIDLYFQTINFQKKFTKMVIVRKILTKKERKRQKSKEQKENSSSWWREGYDVFKAINGIFKPTNNYLINWLKNDWQIKFQWGY